MQINDHQRALKAIELMIAHASNRSNWIHQIPPTIEQVNILSNELIWQARKDIPLIVEQSTRAQIHALLYELILRN